MSEDYCHLERWGVASQLSNEACQEGRLQQSTYLPGVGESEGCAQFHGYELALVAVAGDESDDVRS